MQEKRSKKTQLNDAKLLSDNSCIFATLLATKVPKDDDEELIQDKTISISVQKKVGLSSQFKTLLIQAVSCALNTAAYNSNRDIVCLLSGATPDFTQSNLTYAFSKASANEWICILFGFSPQKTHRGNCKSLSVFRLFQKVVQVVVIP